jgi:hypothetical protein
MTNLTKAEYAKAIQAGIRDAILELITPETFLEAVTEGVSQGMYGVACANSPMPSVDFYEAIGRGVEDGMTQVGMFMANHPPPEPEPERTP